AGRVEADMGRALVVGDRQGRLLRVDHDGVAGRARQRELDGLVAVDDVVVNDPDLERLHEARVVRCRVAAAGREGEAPGRRRVVGARGRSAVAGRVADAYRAVGGALRLAVARAGRDGERG